MRRWLFYFWLLFILLSAFGLRLFRIESQSIWWDEGISLHLATSTWGEIVADRVVNIHPPLYFFLLKIWVFLTGTSPFSARYLSALMSFLQVPAVFSLSRRWFGTEGRWIVWPTAVLVAFSPLSIIYAQEVRVYAFLPLIYFGLIGFMFQAVYGDWQDASSRRSLIWFGLTAWLGIHLHYIAAFMVVICGCWGMLAFIRQKKWHFLRRLFVVGIGVVGASLPWFAAVLGRLPQVQAEANAGTYLTEPVPVGFLLKQVWVFHLSGLAGGLRFEWIKNLAAAVFVLAGVLLLVQFFNWTKKESQEQEMGLKIVGWLGLWLIPLASALYIWSVRSFSHPRYVSMFAFGLFPLLAGIALPWSKRPYKPIQRLQKVFGVVLLVTVLSLSLLSLSLYYFDPEVEKDDMRSAATYLETAASADDLILIPDTDYSFLFEYSGETAVVMARLNEPDHVWHRLSTETSNLPTVFLVDYTQGTRDWQNFLPFALNKSGVLVQTTQFEDILVHQYQLFSPLQAPNFDSGATAVSETGTLKLNGAFVEPAGSGSVAVALDWQVRDSIPEQLNGTLRLTDDNGWVWHQTTIQLVDARGRPTDLWLPASQTVTYHILPLPYGLPPGAYTVTLDLFERQDDNKLDFFDLNGRSIPHLLGQTEVVPAVPMAADAVSTLPRLAQPLQFSNDLALLGYRVDRVEAAPGQSVFAQLLWLNQGQHPLDHVPTIEVISKDGERMATATMPVLDKYPPHVWPANQPVLEYRQLVVPGTASGSYSIQLQLNNEIFEIGQLLVAPAVHQFGPPEPLVPLAVQFGEVGRLVGVDIDNHQAAAGEPIQLTLYWQAMEGTADVPYKIFVHLLNEAGEIVGQDDNEPVAGKRPFTGWAAGEFIADAHLFEISPQAAAGPAQIRVGVYDPVTGDRLLTPAGADHVILPLDFEIEPLN